MGLKFKIKKKPQARKLPTQFGLTKKQLFLRLCDYQKLYLNRDYSFFEKLLIKFQIKFATKVIIPNLDVHLTTRCTLRCRDCSHKIPYYQKQHQHVMNFDEFRDELNIILKNCSRLYNLLLLGGEPLLNPDLAKMVQYAITKRKIERICIITNGTMVPDENLISTLKTSKKNVVFISDYSLNKDLKNYQPQKILDICKSNNVACSIHKGGYWAKQPDLCLDAKKDIELSKCNFKRCYFKQITLWSNGKIYPCAYSKFINDQTNNKFDSQFILLNNKNLGIKEFKKFFASKYFDVCACCDMTHYGEKIIPAIQLEDNKS